MTKVMYNGRMRKLYDGARGGHYVLSSGRKVYLKVKGAKKKVVTREDGEQFNWSEGALPFPENLDSPARTIITSEGGQTPSRFKHIILDPWKEQYRTLTPEEVEKICGFPSGWTNTGMPDNWRYFCMGNALVVGLIEKMGKILLNSPRLAT